MGFPSLFSFGRASREYLPDRAVSLRPQRGLVASPERRILSYRGLRGETIPIFSCRPASASHFESLSFRKPMYCEGCERCSQPFCLRGRRIYLRGPSNEKGTRQSRPSRRIGLQGRSWQRRERRAKRSQSRKSASRQNIRNPSARFPSPAGATAQKQRLMQRTTVHDKSGAIDFSCDRSFDRERDRRYPNRRARKARRQNG